MNDDREDKPFETSRRVQGPRRIVLHDRTKVTLPTRYLSPSAVGLYLECPRAYWFRYIYGWRSEPNPWLVRGTAGHWALFRYNNVLLQSKGNRRLSAKKVFDIFVENFLMKSEHVSTQAWAKARRSKSDIIDSVEASLKHYVDEVAPGLNVLCAERPFRKNVRGLPVGGIVDLILGDKDDLDSQSVRDYKFLSPSSEYFRAGHADDSLQLGTYGLITGIKDSGYLAIVCEESKPAVKVIPTKVGHHRRETVRREYVHVAKAISVGAFPMCPPKTKRCNDFQCDFWPSCRGAKPGKAVQP